LLFIIALNQN